MFVDDKQANVGAAQKYGFNGFTYDARKQPGTDLFEGFLAIDGFKEWFESEQ